MLSTGNSRLPSAKCRWQIRKTDFSRLQRPVDPSEICGLLAMFAQGRAMPINQSKGRSSAGGFFSACLCPMCVVRAGWTTRAAQAEEAVFVAKGNARLVREIGNKWTCKEGAPARGGTGSFPVAAPVRVCRAKVRCCSGSEHPFQLLPVGQLEDRQACRSESTGGRQNSKRGGAGDSGACKRSSNPSK